MNLKLYSLSVKEGLKMSKIIDTHTHIYDEQFQEDFDDVMKNIEEQMEGIVSIGFDMESSLKSIELANKYDFIHAVIGIHPVDIKKYNAEVDKELEKLALSVKNHIYLQVLYFSMNFPYQNRYLQFLPSVPLYFS